MFSVNDFLSVLVKKLINYISVSSNAPIYLVSIFCSFILFILVCWAIKPKQSDVPKGKIIEGYSDLLRMNMEILRHNKTSSKSSTLTELCNILWFTFPETIPACPEETKALWNEQTVGTECKVERREYSSDHSLHSPCRFWLSAELYYSQNCRKIETMSELCPFLPLEMLVVTRYLVS